MKNSQKGFVVPLLIAIIAVLVIGGGVYIYNNKKVEAPVVSDTQTQTQTSGQTQQQTNTQTPPANNLEPCTNNGSMGTRKCNPPQTNTLNWKTYTNTKYGFEIKYPTDWYVTDLSSLNHYLLALNPQTRQIPSDTPVNRDGDYKGYIEITISPNPAKLSLQSFYDGTKHENLYSKDVATNGVEKIITMNKIEGTLFKGVSGLGIYNIASFGLDNNIVEVQDNSQKPYDSNSIFARIISTFKFTSTNTNTTNPPVTNNQSPVLKVNGPQSLDLNQVGTWTDNGYSPNDKGEGSTLIYSVKWGDSSIVPKFGTEYPPFTHAYSKFGTYTIVFTAKDSTGAQTTTSTSVSVVNKVTYTYTNHGFSIELPKGFIPKEEQSEGGPALMISLPIGGVAYVSDASFWEKYNISNYIYVKDQKIGDTTFKVYTAQGSNLYWLKEGNVGYEFSVQKFGVTTDTTGLENLLKTFKFVGWPQN